MPVIITGDMDIDHGDPGLTTMVHGAFLPIIAPGETVNIDVSVTLLWAQVNGDANVHKFLPIKITLLSWDRSARRHKTVYNLMATNDDSVLSDRRAIAPRVTMGTRITTSDPVWLLRL